MSKTIFIDVKEKELYTYIFEGRHGKYEIKDSKKYPLTDMISLLIVQQGI
jgi:hypothetical protein